MLAPFTASHAYLVCCYPAPAFQYPASYSTNPCLYLQPIIKERSCRDVLFLLFFVMFWGGMIVIGIFAFSRGAMYSFDPLDKLRAPLGSEIVLRAS